jgi:hypothetical protein
MEEESLDNDDTMKKSHIMRAFNYMVLMTKQNMGVEQELAKEYYEKVQALHCILRMIDLYERQIILDLDVD